MPSMLTAVKQRYWDYQVYGAQRPRLGMLLTMIESTIRLSEMDAAMSTDGKKNSMNPPTSALPAPEPIIRQCSILCPL